MGRFTGMGVLLGALTLLRGPAGTTPDQRGRPYIDLAPTIYRQRLVVEGISATEITAEMISDYLRRLGPVLDMVVLTDPVTHRSEMYGESAWVHWSTSGAHAYIWDSPLLFVSVDIYTCKAFDPAVAIEFTRATLGLVQVTAKGF